MPAAVYDQVYERDNGRCVICGDRNVQAHHVIYRSEGGPHTVENLVLVCPKDHSVIHGNKKVWQPTLLKYITNRARGVSCRATNYL